MKQVVKLDKFKPRDYQFPLFEAFEEKGYKRLIAIWPRRCLSGSSEVLLVDGATKLLRDIEAGDRIISWDGSLFEEDTVVSKWKTGLKETVKVMVDSYRPIITSPDHQFATVDYLGRDLRWVSAKDLGVDRFVLTNPSQRGRSRRKILCRGCFNSRATVVPGELELLYDIETEKNHNFVANGYVVHNSGKDVCAWNLCIRELLRNVQTIYYVFPTFSNGRRILWDNIDNDGKRLLSYLPDELIESKNEQMMRIKLINGSVFQILGSDSYDNTIVGTNPKMVIFSEFALSDPMAYQLAVMPILAANNGTVLFISTPRAKNFFFDLYQIALKNPEDWWTSKLTVDDTKHVTLDKLLKDRENGLMSEDLQLQEYWTSFECGASGAYYSKYMSKLNLQGKLSKVGWRPDFPVNTSWDVGYRDATSICFFQVVGTAIHVIDHYEKNKEGMEHFAEVIKSKPYTYGVHIGPHDIRNHEQSSGTTRFEKLRQLGVNLVVCPLIGLMDGIEAVRTTLPRCWFDERNCKLLIRALENYSQEWDSRLKIYKPTPKHDQYSHAADSFRYLSLYLPMLRDGMTPEDVRALKIKAKYGNRAQFGPAFR